MMKPHCASLLLVCAASAGASAAPADPVRDHDTIVRMQGEYTVDFAFDETVLLQPGYARAPAMRSGGNELVVVVESMRSEDDMRDLFRKEVKPRLANHAEIGAFNQEI